MKEGPDFDLGQQAATVAITQQCAGNHPQHPRTVAETCTTHICFRKCVQSGFTFTFIYKTSQTSAFVVSPVNMQHQGKRWSKHQQVFHVGVRMYMQDDMHVVMFMF